MIIKKIELSNFLPFKDNTVIEFSCGDQGITVIKAENNVGKSSLLKGFLWCLYGKLESGEDVLNSETKNSISNGREGRTEKVIVKLTIGHNTTDYVFTRVAQYTKNKSNITKSETFKAYKIIGGNSQDIAEDDLKETVDTILPYDLAEYFFYEEKKFSEIGKKKSIKKSVEDFCGLTPLKYALRDVKKAKVLFHSDMRDTGNGTLATHEKERLKWQNEKEAATNNFANAESELAYYTQQLDIENAKLLQKADDDALRENIKREQQHLAILQDDQPNLEDKVFQKFNENFLGFVESLPYFREVVKILKTADDGNPIESIPGVEVASIDAIITRQRCLCGAKIIRGTDGYNNLMNERRKVPPNSLSDVVRSFQTNLETKTDYYDSYADGVFDSYKQMKKNYRQIDSVTKHIEEYKAEIRGANLDEIEVIRQNIEDYKEEIQKKQKEQFQHKLKIERANAELETLDKKIKKLAKADKENAYIQKCIDHASAVEERLQIQIDNKTQDTLSLMNNYVTDYFNQIYHGKLYLNIDEDYSIQFYQDPDHKRKITNVSTGTNDIKNFAFVFGLEKMAKNRISLVGEEDADGVVEEPYPLVLDGPFSHTDGEHIKNICRLLPTVSQQTIIAVSRKDWELSKQLLSQYVGAIYEMTAVTEQHTSVKKGDLNV